MKNVHSTELQISNFLQILEQILHSQDQWSSVISPTDTSYSRLCDMLTNKFLVKPKGRRWSPASKAASRYLKSKGSGSILNYERKHGIGAPALSTVYKSRAFSIQTHGPSKDLIEFVCLIHFNCFIDIISGMELLSETRMHFQQQRIFSVS